MSQLTVDSWRPSKQSLLASGVGLLTSYSLYLCVGMKKYILIIMSLLGGLILSLGWPAGGFPGLLFIGFIPFFFIEDYIQQNRGKFGSVSVFLYTYAGFLVWNILTTWWIWNSTAVGSIAAMTLNALFMAFMFHLYHYSRKWNVSRLSFLILVFYWISFEYIHHRWELTWPWLSLGNGFAHYVKWIQWYEYTGIFGGTAWVLIVNILFYSALKRFFAGKRKISGMVQAILAILIIYTPISISNRIYDRYEETEAPVDIIVVQPNLDPYNEQYTVPPLEALDRNLDLAEQLLDSTVEYIVSPESAIQEDIWENRLEASPALSELQDYVDEHPCLQVVIGASTFREFEEGEALSPSARKFRDADVYYDAFNTAFCVSADTGLQYYHKSKLTPGVERMPYPAVFKPLERFAINLGGTVGSLGVDKERKVFGRTQDDLKVAPVICYESVFGEYLNEYIKNGAHLIFVITNDGWWGNTPGHRQHLTFSSLRAIETRRSVARSANTGISAFIDQRGNIHQATGYWVTAVIRQEINANDKITFYVRYGDYIGRISLFTTVFLLLITISRRLRRRSL